MYDAVSKMVKLNLIEFTDYDNKDYIMIQNKDGGFDTVELTFEEKLALTYMNIAKMQLSYMCRYDTPNGGVQYELAKDKKNMQDDAAYTMAEGAYALSVMRRENLLEKPKNTDFDPTTLFQMRQPVIRKH